MADSVEEYIFHMNCHYPTLGDEIYDVLEKSGATETQKSITFEDLKQRFKAETGKKFPIEGPLDVQISYIQSLPYICCYSVGDGYYRFFAMNNFAMDKFGDQYIFQVNCEYPTLGDDILDVLEKAGATNTQKSLTLNDLKDGFKAKTGKKFPIEVDMEIQVSYIQSLPYICCYSAGEDNFRFFSMKNFGM